MVLQAGPYALPAAVHQQSLLREFQIHPAWVEGQHSGISTKAESDLG